MPPSLSRPHSELQLGAFVSATFHCLFCLFWGKSGICRFGSSQFGCARLLLIAVRSTVPNNALSSTMCPYPYGRSTELGGLNKILQSSVPFRQLIIICVIMHSASQCKLNPNGASESEVHPALQATGTNWSTRVHFSGLCIYTSLANKKYYAQTSSTNTMRTKRDITYAILGVTMNYYHRANQSNKI